MIEEPTIKVKMSTTFVTGVLWGLRTDDGRHVQVDIGEPDADGFYEPIFTATADEWYLDHIRATRVTAALRALVEELKA